MQFYDRFIKCYLAYLFPQQVPQSCHKMQAALVLEVGLADCDELVQSCTMP